MDADSRRCEGATLETRAAESTHFFVSDSSRLPRLTDRHSSPITCGHLICLPHGLPEEVRGASLVIQSGSEAFWPFGPT
jgi:hypothetical protein